MSDFDRTHAEDGPARAPEPAEAPRDVVASTGADTALADPAAIAREVLARFNLRELRAAADEADLPALHAAADRLGIPGVRVVPADGGAERLDQLPLGFAREAVPPGRLGVEVVARYEEPTLEGLQRAIADATRAAGWPYPGWPG